jgi:hypothetical protein
MPRLERPLTPGQGAVVEVVVGLSLPEQHYQQFKKQPIPSPLKTQAVIDTGADKTIVRTSVLASLGTPSWRPVTLLPLMGANQTTGMHRVSLEILGFPSQVKFDKVEVLAYDDVRNHGIDVLIGCDLLDQGAFDYNRPPGHFTLEFP